MRARKRIVVNENTYIGFSNGEDSFCVEALIVREGRVVKTAYLFEVDDKSVPQIIIPPADKPETVINMEFTLTLYPSKLTGVLCKGGEVVDAIALRDRWYTEY